MMVVRDLFRSKKFVAALIAMISALAGKFGLEWDNAFVATLITPLVIFIGGQGVADAGKEKAKIEQAKIDERIQQAVSEAVSPLLEELRDKVSEEVNRDRSE